MWSAPPLLRRSLPRLSTLTTRSLASLPRDHDIKIVEVGPRDGLQNEKAHVSAADKIQLIQLLAQAGCTYIETGAFVSPKWVPSMATSQEVMEGLKGYEGRKGRVFSCLTPNTKGLEQAIQAQADEIAIFGSASEAFSQKNINCSIEESLERFSEVAQQAKEKDIPMRGYVSCVMVRPKEKGGGCIAGVPMIDRNIFLLQGCPYQGEVKPSEVARVTAKLLELGCHEVSLGDTIGVGTPGPTKEVIAAVQVSFDSANLFNAHLFSPNLDEFLDDCSH